MSSAKLVFRGAENHNYMRYGAYNANMADMILRIICDVLDVNIVILYEGENGGFEVRNPHHKFRCQDQQSPVAYIEKRPDHYDALIKKTPIQQPGDFHEGLFDHSFDQIEEKKLDEENAEEVNSKSDMKGKEVEEKAQRKSRRVLFKSAKAKEKEEDAKTKPKKKKVEKEKEKEKAENSKETEADNGSNENKDGWIGCDNCPGWFKTAEVDFSCDKCKKKEDCKMEHKMKQESKEREAKIKDLEKRIEKQETEKNKLNTKVNKIEEDRIKQNQLILKDKEKMEKEKEKMTKDHKAMKERVSMAEKDSTKLKNEVIEWKGKHVQAMADLTEMTKRYNDIDKEPDDENEAAANEEGGEPESPEEKLKKEIGKLKRRIKKQEKEIDEARTQLIKAKDDNYQKERSIRNLNDALDQLKITCCEKEVSKTVNKNANSGSKKNNSNVSNLPKMNVNPITTKTVMKIPIPCTRIGLCDRETCQMQHVEDMNNITTQDNETSPVTEKPHFIQDKQNSNLDQEQQLQKEILSEPDIPEEELESEPEDEEDDVYVDTDVYMTADEDGEETILAVESFPGCGNPFPATEIDDFTTDEEDDFATSRESTIVKQTRRDSEAIDFVKQTMDERPQKEEQDGECDGKEGQKEGEFLTKKLGNEGDRTESRNQEKEGEDKTPKRSPKKIPCRYYARGKCSNPKCSFTHSEEDRNKNRNNDRRDTVDRSRGNYKELPKDERIDAHRDSGSRGKELPKGERSDAYRDAGGRERDRGHNELEECYYFNRYGNCRFDDRCYYYHNTKANRRNEKEHTRDTQRWENRHKDVGETHKQQNDKGLSDIKVMVEKMTSQQEAVKKQFNFLEDGMKKIRRYLH